MTNIAPCPDCTTDKGIYDFDLDCCVVRFILHVPTKIMRVGYLNWLVNKIGAKRTETVKELVAKEWDRRRPKSDSDKAIKA